ncbi:MAG: ABC transporter substrate-binding protein [Pseudomonadota bacterium]|nr:ABC transporter substrate-binding protein [Pseudomonadota bacterium]
MKRLNKFFTLGVSMTLLVCLASTLQAATDDDITLRKAQNLTDRVLKRLKSRKSELKSHPERIPGAVGDIVKSTFNFTAMSSSAMGKHWRKASSSQKKRVTDAFGNLLIRTYGLALLNYTGKPVEYGKPQRSKDNKRVVIPSKAFPSTGRPLSIRYYMSKSGANWSVYDVKIDGVSLMTNYRENFNTEIRKGGIDGLIQSLKRRATAK